jgi:hypothetical protein
LNLELKTNLFLDCIDIKCLPHGKAKSLSNEKKRGICLVVMRCCPLRGITASFPEAWSSENQKNNAGFVWL